MLAIIDGVTIWGTLTTELNPTELAEVNYTYWNLAHCARHFRELDQDSLNYLLTPSLTENIETPLTKGQIQDLLVTAGSKFTPRLNRLRFTIDTLLSFLPLAASNRTYSWIEFSSLPGSLYTEIHLTLNTQQKEHLGLPPHEPVGTLGVVTLTAELKAYVQQEKRGKGEASDQIVLNTITGVTPPTTDTITIGLKKDPQTHKVTLASLYTSDGHFSPLFPDKKTQSPEEFSYNSTYWQKQAFFR